MWGSIWLSSISLSWWLPLYIWVSLCLHIMARKTDTQYAWLAWVPIVNLYILCVIAGQSGWWVILFFIPIVNIIFYIYIWMNIAEMRNQPSWLGLLMLVPVVNFVILGILAFEN